ncbi:MAG: 1,4-dihydroxy-2-naphthoate polyprenyltransferase [Eubacteriaceae bacterium]|nr:1,4-dihydroxy-2-naphthoate polyprenyltransferase [Eubacteriaceae bacterium]
MNIKSFLRLAEIQTKVASQIPLMMGTMYVLFRYSTFKPLNFLLMLVSLLSFDIATTVINNYMDFKKAIKKEGYGYERHNAMVRYGLRESDVLILLSVLILTAVAAGIFLFLNTSIITLLVGMISFAVGILYTFGPVPISRTPFGEIFSGFIMGFFIIFLSVYIHVYDSTLISISLISGFLSLDVDVLEMLRLALFSFAPIICIANIMLANNICDMDDDIINLRYTLPVYIGKENALKLFEYSYMAVYPVMLLMILSGTVPLVFALYLATLIPVRKNIKIFMKLQTKRDTFVMAIKNFMLMNATQILLMGIALIIM